MASRPSQDEASAANSSCPEQKLSTRAQEIKKKIREGSYHIDLDALAARLIDDAALEVGSRSSTALPEDVTDCKNQHNRRKE